MRNQDIVRLVTLTSKSEVILIKQAEYTAGQLVKYVVLNDIKVGY